MAQEEEFPLEDFGKIAREICAKSESFNAQNDRNSYYFVVSTFPTMFDMEQECLIKSLRICLETLVRTGSFALIDIGDAAL